jgi:hypothetical protein
MSAQTIKFFGSDSDLRDLREALLQAGFKEHDEVIIHASHDIIPASITFIMGVGFGKCVRTFLQTRNKRMVSRMVSKGKKKTVIRGPFSIKEIERILKIPYSHNIEDDINDPSHESSQRSVRQR